MNRQRVARYVKETPSDAWIVCASSQEILEWFAQQDFKTLAVYGRFYGLPIASVSPQQSTAMIECVDRLVELGHRRIVMLTRKERRQPKPAQYEQSFLNALKAHGLPSGSDNLPEWEESLSGLRAFLDSLFDQTPPTALLLQESQLLMATQQFLANQGIPMPGHVSLFCIDHNPCFDWCDPPIAHSRWDHEKVLQFIVSWAKDVANGKTNTDQIWIDTEFVEGGTIAPAHYGAEDHSDKIW